jgi:hypothetical protein
LRARENGTAVRPAGEHEEKQCGHAFVQRSVSWKYQVSMREGFMGIAGTDTMENLAWESARRTLPRAIEF